MKSDAARGAARRRRAAFVIVVGASCATFAACGRTGLELDDYPGVNGLGATGIGGAGGSGLEAPDGGSPQNSNQKPDGAPADAAKDVATEMEPDAAPAKPDCSDPTSTWIYVVTDSGELYGYDPAAGVYHARGTLNCPSAGGAAPFSMAVSRTGTAFVVFNDGSLYRVSTKTAACSATKYVPGQLGFLTFGMGFSTVGAGPDEKLYVAQTPEQIGMGGISALATIDTTSFALSLVGDFTPQVIGAELTGTGDGRLFAFAMDSFDMNQSHILQVDKTDAHVTVDMPLPDVMIANGWAFAFWGGTFWLFTSPGQMGAGTPTLTNYDPATGKASVVGSPPGQVVGAGVSTCAPAQ